MWKQMLLWCLSWAKKRIANMSEAEKKALDDRLDKRLKIKDGSPQDRITDILIDLICEVAKKL